MITVAQYFAKPHTTLHEERAADLLRRVEALRAEHRTDTGRVPVTDPDTGSEISGVHNGQGDGGFRSPVEGSQSAHEEAMAVDVFDPGDHLDNWISANNAMLVKHGLYREHPSATPGWCHLSTRPPRSGKRTFYP